MKQLLLGAGSDHRRKVQINGQTEWSELITLDYNEDHKPDIVHDLNSFPYPFEDNSFDEIHAYDVLEHCGKQGDYRFFFEQFSEIHRILKPGGYFAGIVPKWDSVWAFGDPSHTRVIPLESLIFLNQAEYANQVGKTPMSDFRFCYKADFDVVHAEYPIKLDVLSGKQVYTGNAVFILQAKK